MLRPSTIPLRKLVNATLPKTRRGFSSELKQRRSMAEIFFTNRFVNGALNLDQEHYAFLLIGGLALAFCSKKSSENNDPKHSRDFSLAEKKSNSHLVNDSTDKKPMEDEGSLPSQKLA